MSSVWQMPGSLARPTRVFGVATVATFADAVTLDLWGIRPCDEEAYMAPEMRPNSVVGVVYHYPTHRFEDGDSIRTGNIIGHHGHLVRTQRTLYHLGRPHPEYAEACAKAGRPVSIDTPLPYGPALSFPELLDGLTHARRK